MQMKKYYSETRHLGNNVSVYIYTFLLLFSYKNNCDLYYLQVFYIVRQNIKNIQKLETTTTTKTALCHQRKSHENTSSSTYPTLPGLYLRKLFVFNEFLGGKSKEARQVTCELLIYILTKGNVLPKSRSSQQISGVNGSFCFTVSIILSKRSEWHKQRQKRSRSKDV